MNDLEERYHGKNLIHSLKQIGEEYWISMEDHRRILGEIRAEWDKAREDAIMQLHLLNELTVTAEVAMRIYRAKELLVSARSEKL